jgi:hypothetical protein
MPTETIVVVSLIVAVFAAFSAALAFGIVTSGK